MVPETLHANVATDSQSATGDASAEKPQELRLTRLIWLMAPFLVIDFGMIFTYPFVFPQYPFFLEKIQHYSASQYGLLFSASGLALAVFPLVTGRLSERMPKKPLIVVGSLLFSALNLSMCVAPIYPLLLTGAALAGLGSAFVEPAMGSIYLGATTDENRGRIMGMRGSAISLAVMLGPLTQALAGLWISAHTTCAIGVALSLSMALVAALLLKNSKLGQR
jgi:MFS family permease